MTTNWITNMRMISKLAPACALALCFPMLANATGQWYLGGSLGQATTDVSDNTVSDRLADEGLAGSASVSDTSRLGWRLFGGYAVNRWLGLEAGYTRLGDIGMTVSGSGTLSRSQLEAIRPASGSGIELAALGRYPFSDRLDGMVRAGLFHWTQEYELGSGESGSFSGDDLVYGIGAEWRLDDRWSTRLSWDRYIVAQDETSLLAVGLTWRFPAGADAPVAAREMPPLAALSPAPAPEPVQSAPVESALPEAAPQPRTVQFGFKRTKLEGDRSAIDATADYLASHPQARVRIIGHTDTSGAESFNPYLSRLRAQAVADALTAKGVDRARMTVEGKGAAEPAGDNKTRAGRLRNRRAEIQIQETVAR